MLGDEGAQFYAVLKELADNDDFKLTTQTLAQEDMEQKANEELVLRFLAAKNARAIFRGSVRDWLDDFMEGVLLKTRSFDPAVAGLFLKMASVHANIFRIAPVAGGG